MKKLIFILLLGFANTCFSQELLGRYQSSYFGSDYNIMISKKHEATIFIYATPMGGDFSKGGILLTHRSYIEFNAALKRANSLYEKWNNNVKKDSVNKLDVSAAVTCGFKHLGEIYFDSSVNLKFTLLSYNREHCLLITTGDLMEDSGKASCSGGYGIGFTSPKEVGNFIRILSAQNIEAVK